MERYTTNTMTVERKGVFDKSRKKRFELTFTCKDSRQKKSILVIGLNPASDDISMIDTTTTFILNNLIPMGYTTVTICNLYGELFKQRLKSSEVPNNTENRKYLKEVLKRGFDTILLGYGNTFLTNKKVKEDIDEILTRSRRGKLRSWYVSYIKIGSQKIPLIYTTKKQSDYRRNEA